MVAYERRTLAGQERIELVPLVPAGDDVHDQAIWYLPEAHHLAGLEEMPRLLGTLHAAEHAMIALLPLWAMCDRWDIGGLSTNIHPQTGRPTVFIYDGHEGGVGIAERGFEQFEGWVRDTAELLAGCPCSDGCPSCVQSPKCGNLNDMLDKAGALTFFAGLSIMPALARRRTTAKKEGEVKYAILIYSTEEGPADPADHAVYMGLSERGATIGGGAAAARRDGHNGAGARRRGTHHRRAVCRDQGGVRGLLLDRCSEPRRRTRVRSDRARCTERRRRDPTSGGKLIDDVFRDEWGRVLANLVGFLGDFDLAEDAAQEAFAIAAERWPREGAPSNPGAWLTTTARNRAIDRIRRERTFAAKAHLVASPDAVEDEVNEETTFRDERLELLFTCCHPALALEVQVALTLRPSAACRRTRSRAPSSSLNRRWRSASSGRRTRSGRPGSRSGFHRLTCFPNA